MLNFDFFKFFKPSELKEQEQRTRAKIEQINKMLSENPDNIFLKSQLNQQLNKLNQLLKVQNYD